MNKKQRAILKGVAAGATFAAAMGDVIDSFARQTNHPAWYEHYPLDSLVSLNFGMRENCELNHNVVNLGNGLVGSGSAPIHFVKPTDAVVHLELTDGLADGRNIIDEAADLVLQQMRSIATTTAPYTKTDVANYIRNARAIVALYSMCRRLANSVGLADAYDVQAGTKYIAIQIRQMVGAAMDPQPIIDNIAQFRARLGAITPRIRNLIPANMDLMERTKWLFSNIFCDAPSAKFSTKTFVCGTFFMRGDSETEARKYRLHTGTDAGECTGDGSSGNPYKAHTLTHISTASWSTPSTVLDMLEGMIDFMMAQSTTSRIAGDLLKAFGNRAFMDFPDYHPETRVPFVYDEDVLNQIQNLTVAYPTHDVYGQPIFTGRTLMSSPDAAATLSEFPEHIITTYRDEITPGKLLSMTRLCPYAVRETVYYGDAQTQNRVAKFVTYGTEIPLAYEYVDYREASPSVKYRFIASIPHNALYNSAMQVISDWGNDDWAPATVVYTQSTTPTTQRIIIDAQNWTTMNAKDAATYHEIATLSMCLIHELVQKTDTFVFAN